MAATETRSCAKCGECITARSRFCPACGARQEDFLVSDPDPAPTPPEPEPAPAPPPPGPEPLVAVLRGAARLCLLHQELAALHEVRTRRRRQALERA